MELPHATPESEAFHLILNLIDRSVCPSRVSRSDAKTYLAVIMDNNSHRTICRLYLNSKHKYIGMISDRKVETRIPINDIYDIKAFSDSLNETARRYVQKYVA